MKLESIEAPIVRDTLRRLGLEPLDGATNNTVEIWITRGGDLVSLPYFRRGYQTHFVKQAFDSIIQQLSP